MSPLSISAEDRTRPRLHWKDAWKPRHLLDPSTLVLLAANLVPLYGVFFLHWDLFLLMLLYWMETGIIGFWHILRMAFTLKWLALFMVPFFTLHFGGFMAGHFMFLTMIFGGEWKESLRDPFTFLSHVVIATGLWVPLLALFLSHGFSFLRNFLLPVFSEPFTTTVAVSPEPGAAASPPEGAAPLPEWASHLKNIGPDIMMAPYKRIVIMHVTILFGGFMSALFHQTRLAFILMVALKIGADFAAHARKNFSPSA